MGGAWAYVKLKMPTLIYFEQSTKFPTIFAAIQEYYIPSSTNPTTTPLPV